MAHISHAPMDRYAEFYSSYFERVFEAFHNDVALALNNQDPLHCCLSQEELREFALEHDDGMLDILTRRHQSACGFGAWCDTRLMTAPHTTLIADPVGGYKTWSQLLLSPVQRMNKPTDYVCTGG